MGKNERHLRQKVLFDGGTGNIYGLFWGLWCCSNNDTAVSCNSGLQIQWGPRLGADIR